MGFKFFSTGQPKSDKGTLSKDLLYNHRCKVCTLNHVRNKTPKMQPTGAKEPIILFIGEAPGADEDTKGEQFVGVSGQLLRPLIPEKFYEWIRWDNAVRCRPPGNRTPSQLEIDCCYKWHEEDIEATKPFAIFGFGNVPLQWAISQTGITRWRGRYLPVKIGDHVCWYFPFFHPSGLLRQRAKENVESEDEFATKLDLTRAFDLVTQLPDPVVYSEQDAKHGITCITGQSKGDLQQVIKFLAYASTKKYAGFDYETQNLRPYGKDSRILTIGVSLPDETLAFAFEHPGSGWSPSELELVRDAFSDFLLSPCHKVVHNVAFEQEWTAVFFGRDKLRATNWEDTIIQAFVLDERPNSFSLEFLSIQYFGLNLKQISSGLNKVKLHEEPVGDVLLYNGMDAKFHYLLYFKQLKRIKADKLQHVYDMQMRRVPTLVLTQMKGVAINFEVNKKLSDKFTAKVEAALNAIKATPEYIKFRDKAGHDLNPGSTRDVEILLRDIIKARSSVKTATGRYSTDEDALSQIDLPIARLILDYRKAVKSHSTYIEPYNPESAKTVIHADGLVHTIYNSIFTSTGRLSSDSPNVQNVSKRDSELAEVRSQFVIGVDIEGIPRS
jgi:uracil-DNA glycosylase family 4